MCSNERAGAFTPAQRETLIALARASILHGLDHGGPLEVDCADYPDALCVPLASFVTLKIAGELRGCIGSLEAQRPLAVDVAHNAHGAAFRDPRFAPLSRAEFPQLEIHLSILSAPQPLSFADEEDLLRQLRPGIDGLILEENGRRGTFLPSVWESLTDPRTFLAHLKRKAGLAPDHWSRSIRAWRYTTESFA